MVSTSIGARLRRRPWRRALGGGELGRGVDQVDDDVGVLGPAPGGADHGAVEPAARLEDAGRVDQHDLGLALPWPRRAPGSGWSAPSG